MTVLRHAIKPDNGSEEYHCPSRLPPSMTSKEMKEHEITDFIRGSERNHLCGLNHCAKMLACTVHTLRLLSCTLCIRALSE